MTDAARRRAAPAGPNRRDIPSTGAAAMAATGLPAAARATALERRVLWAASVRARSLPERLAAAEAGGFTHMSVFPIDHRRWTEGGMAPAEIRSRIRDAKLGVLAIAPFAQWVAGFALPQGYPPDHLGFIDVPEAAILRVAEDLEAEAIDCVEGLGQPHEAVALVQAFGAFAAHASAAGLRVTLEFMPISSIRDFVAGGANAGLCFDTWHHFRSKPDDALLGAVPGAAIFEVQSADALERLQERALTDDLLRFRRLAGEGELDISGATATLKRIGGGLFARRRPTRMFNGYDEVAQLLD